jgi:hypothetical protein
MLRYARRGYLLSAETFAILLHRSLGSSVETEIQQFSLSTQTFCTQNRINLEGKDILCENVFKIYGV